MADQSDVTKNLLLSVKRIGISAFNRWLSEHQISLAGNSKQNYYERIASTLESNPNFASEINDGLAELEENGDKKIFLFQSNGHEDISENKPKVLSNLKKAGITQSQKNWIRKMPGAGPTFNYMFWEDNIIKIRFSEEHEDVEVDYIEGEIVRIPRVVVVVIVFDVKDGFVQIRFDKAGQIHTHRNQENKASETAYEQYYRDLLEKLFPDQTFVPYPLNERCTHLAKHEKDKFRIDKEVTTISSGAKQTYKLIGGIDVRDLPERKDAAKDHDEYWLTEDLVGYWRAKHSGDQLTQDLFMRIYRRTSYIRVERGCLAKELDYGIAQIREIQIPV